MAGDRALPDVVSHFKVDTTGLKKAAAEAQAAGATMGTGLGTASKAAKAAEKDLALMQTRMAAAGVESGKFSSLIGGGLTPQTLALAAGLAIAVKAGASMIDISKNWKEAQLGLEQAVKVSGQSLASTNAQVDIFLANNRKFVSNQAEVVSGWAMLARSGLAATLQTQAMNVALDLSTIKHIPLSDAVRAVTLAEQGRGKALADLGLKMKDYPDLTTAMTQANTKQEAAQKAVTKAQEALTAAVKAHGPHSDAAKKASEALAAAQLKLKDAHQFVNEKSKEQQGLLDALSAKTRGGRQTMDEMTQSQHELGAAWQSLARVAGPPLLAFMSLLFRAFADFVNTISTVISKVGDFIRLVGQAVQGARGLGSAGASATAGMQASTAGAPAGFRRQSGGPVLPGQIYDVGEGGREKLYMYPGGGGYVVPTQGGQSSGSGKTLHQHFYNAHVDALQASREAAWVLRK